MSAFKTQAIVVAAGQGTRLGFQLNKPLVLLNGKPLVIHSLLALEQCSLINSVIVVAAQDNLKEFKRIVREFRLNKIKKIVEGGKERFQSVGRGLKQVDKNTEYVLIHDGARPLVSPQLLKDSVRLAFRKRAVTTAVPVKPTIKKVDPKNLIVKETLIRDTLWEVQTPQVFEKRLLVKAHEKNECCCPTDDAAMVESLGIPVKILKGDYRNIKITTADDLISAEALLGVNREQKAGVGFDIHRLVKGRRLFLGGVPIPFEKGLQGHSDADVVLHAVCDAILGALGQGDIGEQFPNTNQKYKNISSLILLARVNHWVQRAGFKIGNIDTMILAEKPNLKSYKPKMKAAIAQTLGIKKDAVNIKATTMEGLGFGGKKEAIAAWASVSLIKL